MPPSSRPDAPREDGCHAVLVHGGEVGDEAFAGGRQSSHVIPKEELEELAVSV